MKKYILGAVLSLGMLAAPASAFAASLTSVQIQSILSLLSAFGADSATIANVTTALTGGTPSAGNSGFCHTWNTDLTVGSSGDDVSALNQALTSSGIDTTGNTSVFSENNAGDVVAFQSHYGIRQTGYVGPMTRSKLNALYGCGSSTIPTPIPSPTPTPSAYIPVITWTGAKAAGNFEVDAGGQVSIYGSYLAGNTVSTTKVVIGDIQATVTYASDNVVTANVPNTLTPGQSYGLYVYNEKGKSNVVTVKVLSNLTSTVNLYAKDPNPTTGTVTLIWQTASASNVALDMVCGSGTISFSTDKNSNPTCTKGGVWVWYGQSSGSILMTPSGNSSPVSVTFTLTVLDASGNYTNQKQQVVVTFPATVPAPAPWVSGGFSSQQQFGSANMVSTYTYEIKNYRSGLVLDVEPTVNCNDTQIAPYKRDCSQYWFNLSGKAAETYSNVQGNPYVKGGASYRFTGSSGSLNISGFINPSYVSGSPYISPVPDNLDFNFILRDTSNGAVIWSQTLRAQFKG